MRIPTVRIRNKKTGKVVTVNQHDWAMDLGRGTWRGWTLDGGETHVKATEKEIEAAIKTTTPEAFDKPLHIINEDKSPAVDEIKVAAETLQKQEVPVDHRDARIPEGAKEEVETFTDRGGNEKPIKRGRGRPRTSNRENK